MKMRRHESDCASTLQIALSTGLISIFAILLALATPANRKEASRQNLSGFQLGEGADALGNYPDTSVPLSGDTMVTPDAPPTNTTSINVSSSTNFKGTFAASPTTGVVTITDAHPAGIYTVTAMAFGPGGTTTKTFPLTVTSTPCGAGLTAGFTNAADVNAGFDPSSVAIGDFNGDGKQDLAAANFVEDTVSIRLGDGLGGFSGSTNISVGSYPYSVAIGDFNGDGKQDWAVANYGVSGSGTTVSIRLGDGLGGFSGSTEISVGSGPDSVAIGDFNGDGKQDLAVVNASSNTVSIRLGDGLGGFSGSTEVSVGSFPQSGAIGDFNGDGKQDLAVVNYGSGSSSGTVSIRLGDGLGGFSGSTEVSVGVAPYSVAIGDFNGDGKQDLAVVNGASDTVSIRLGDGLGGFSGPTEVSVGSFPLSVATGDFNGDGKQDLAVANQNSGAVSIRLGDGLGGFSGSTEVSVGSSAIFVAIGDFNGDGKQDLAVATFNSDIVSIRLGQCVPVPTPTPTPTLTPVPCTPVLTQSTSQAITTSFLACYFNTPTGNEQLDNSYWRAFRATFVSDFNVSSVSFGVYSTTETMPVTVRLYTNSGAPFPGGTRIQIGTSTINVMPAQSGTVVATPLVATVPAGTSELVMELFQPEHTGRFKVGANMAPETGLSYWSSLCSNCLLPTDNHIVFNVYGSCAGGTSSPTPTATATPTPTATPTGTPCSTIFAENFDSVVAPVLPRGWVAQTFCGAPMWVTSTTTPDSGPNDAFIASSTPVSDKRLETPNMTISGQGAQVSFRNFYNLGIDGGVLEVSSANINGGAFTDITNAAVGGSFATGGYNAFISADWNPLTGRMAWSGNSGGYINTVANLGPNVAGQTIRLRFRMGSTFASSSSGWRIDTISVVAGSGPCSSPTPTPTPAATPTPTPSPTPSPGICGTLLYDQTSSSGTATVSQNFEPANDAFDSQVADDFVVPAGSVWTIQRVNVSGVYFNGPGPATSVNVSFYFNSGTLPGAAVPGGIYTNLPVAVTAGNFSIALPTNLVLSAGTYWVSVQANMDFTPGGEWGWLDRTVQSNSPAAWQNPGGGFGSGCLSWGARAATCGVDPTAPDQIFQVVGCLGPRPSPSPSPTPPPMFISGTISYCPNPALNPVPGVTMTLTGTLSGTTTTDTNGNYTLVPLLPGGSYTVTPSKGDLPPGAGTTGINTADALLVQKHFLSGSTLLTGCALAAAHTNANNLGDPNVSDALFIQQFFLFSPNPLPVANRTGQWRFSPANRSYANVTSNQTGQNYDAYALGDVNGDLTIP